MAATGTPFSTCAVVTALAAAAMCSGCVTQGANSDGSSTTQPAAAPAPTAPAAAPDFAAADTGNGARVYQSLCAFCHGDGGRGGTGGGTSLRIAATPQEIANVVTGGRNMMPSMSANLSAEEIRDVAVYVADRFGIGE